MPRKRWNHGTNKHWLWGLGETPEGERPRQHTPTTPQPSPAQIRHHQSVLVVRLAPRAVVQLLGPPCLERLYRIQLHVPCPQPRRQRLAVVPCRLHRYHEAPRSKALPPAVRVADQLLKSRRIAAHSADLPAAPVAGHRSSYQLPLRHVHSNDHQLGLDLSTNLCSPGHVPPP